MSEPIPEPTSEPMSELVSQPASEPIPADSAETAPETSLETASKAGLEVTPEPAPEVPEMSFEEAIALTQSLMAQMEQGTLTEEELEATLAQLVSTENGARGFFVTYLTDERSLADAPSAGVIGALQSAPETVAELLVKNLAMSSAMAIAHRRNQDEAAAQGSDQVRSRTLHLIQQLQLPLVIERAQKLHESAVTGTGSYKTFLDRWGYDAEQRQVIEMAMEQVMPPLETPPENSA